MVQLIISIRDIKSDTFSRPMFTHNYGTAIRMFTDEVNRESEDNQLFKHSADYQLFDLGNFDDVTGRLEGQEIPKLIITAESVKLKKEK